MQAFAMPLALEGVDQGAPLQRKAGGQGPGDARRDASQGVEAGVGGKSQRSAVHGVSLRNIFPN